MPGMFQRAITVHPNSVRHMGDDKFAQACFVGYKYGTFTKLGIICERTRPEQYANAGAEEEVKGGEQAMEVDEDSNMQAAAAQSQKSNAKDGVKDLSAFNMEEFIRKIKMQGEKPQDKQKVHQRNIKVLNLKQVGSESEGNIIFIVPELGDSIVKRFRITDN